jgi:ParB-like chromosome segregation protein Spo0J
MSPHQRQELRALHGEGWTQADLAKRFACSPTTVANYLAGDVVAERTTSARQAVDEFVQALGPLDAERRAAAAIALALADRIDGSRGPGTAAMAASTLANLVRELASDVRREESEAHA